MARVVADQWPFSAQYDREEGLVRIVRTYLVSDAGERLDALIGIPHAALPGGIPSTITAIHPFATPETTITLYAVARDIPERGAATTDIRVRVTYEGSQENIVSATIRSVTVSDFLQCDKDGNKIGPEGKGMNRLAGQEELVIVENRLYSSFQTQWNNVRKVRLLVNENNWYCGTLDKTFAEGEWLYLGADMEKHRDRNSWRFAHRFLSRGIYTALGSALADTARIDKSVWREKSDTPDNETIDGKVVGIKDMAYGMARYSQVYQVAGTAPNANCKFADLLL